MNDLAYVKCFPAMEYEKPQLYSEDGEYGGLLMSRRCQGGSGIRGGGGCFCGYGNRDGGLCAQGNSVGH